MLREIHFDRMVFKSGAALSFASIPLHTTWYIGISDRALAREGEYVSGIKVEGERERKWVRERRESESGRKGKKEGE